MAKNTIIWADIPVTDLARARKFYGAVLQMDIPEVPGQEGLALLPPLGGGPAGQEEVVSADLYVGGKPTRDGATVYLDAMGDIGGMVKRIEEAGGQILQQPQDMGQMVGVIAFFLDTEGNRLGVRAPSGQH